MLTSLLRTLILYIFIILALRIMGKRQVGELEPGELVSAILISNLSAVPMQDMGIPLLHGVIPIVAIFSVEMMISAITAASPRAKSIITGKVSVVVKNGQINQTELAKLRINVMELMEELRQKDIFDPSTVGCAYLEPNGELSVQLIPGERLVTASQLSIDTSSDPELYTTIIAHGRVMSKNLQLCGRDENWLTKTLSEQKISTPADVYLMILDNKGGVILLPREDFSKDKGNQNA